MGLNHANKQLILKHSPEKLQLINRLYNYNRSRTWTEKFWNVFTNTDKTQAHSIAKWCRLLGKEDNNDTARNLIEDLWDMGAFEKDGETHNGHPELVLDRKELIRCYGESGLYSYTRELNFAVIDMYEDNRKIVTDW